MVGPTSLQVSAELERDLSGNRFIVNIGCHDGKSSNDPCYPFFERGYPGLAIDGREYQGIHQNLPFDWVKKLLNQYMTPQNSPFVLTSNGCPKDPHMIKIDVDGIDGDLLTSLLGAGFRPDFFQIEVQPEIPPPIVFSVKYHPLFRPRGGFGGFYGVSISAVEVIARSFGYTPVHLDLTTTHDIVCLRDDLLACSSISALDIQAAYSTEKCHHFHFNQSGIASKRWENRQDWQLLLSEIFQACVFASQASQGVALPFELGIDWMRCSSSSSGSAGWAA